MSFIDTLKRLNDRSQRYKMKLMIEAANHAHKKIKGLCKANAKLGGTKATYRVELGEYRNLPFDQYASTIDTIKNRLIADGLTVKVTDMSNSLHDRHAFDFIVSW